MKKDVLVFKILDPSLKDVRLFDSYLNKKHVLKPASSLFIGEFDGHELNVADRKKLCFRLFSRHAYWAFRQATNNKWTSDVCPNDFGSPLQNGSVTNWIKRRQELYERDNLEDYCGAVDTVLGIEINRCSEAEEEVEEIFYGIYAISFLA